MKLEVTATSDIKSDPKTKLVLGKAITLYGKYRSIKFKVNHLLNNNGKQIKIYLSVGNSDSAEDSAVSCLASKSRMFGGYEANGCVCGGVNTGADCSDL